MPTCPLYAWYDITVHMDSLSHRLHIDKPWGSFEQFTLNEQTTVKILRIKEGEMFSLQRHNNRKEFWHIIKGSGTVVINEKEHTANEGNEFFIEKEDSHRIIGGTGGIEVLEIAYGTFDENDIVRLEDKYGRI